MTAKGEPNADQAASFFYINFLAVLQQHFPPSELMRLASDAARNSRLAQGNFLDQLNERIETLNAHSTSSNGTPTLQRHLNGWSQEILDQLRRPGGLLVALFHYGAHREVILDLSSHDIPLAIPVSAEAAEQYGKFNAALSRFRQVDMQLLPLNDRKTSRSLLMALKQGVVGALYVDGHMGLPSVGNQPNASDKVISFLGKRIRVNCGIARLARALNIPILPVFARPPESEGELGEVIPGDVVTVPAGKSTASLVAAMESLYGQLAKEIVRDPVQWEYGVFLHRCLVPDLAPGGDAGITPRTVSPADRIRCHTTRVGSVTRDGKRYWVDAQAQVGIHLPDNLRAVFDALETDTGISVAAFEKLADKEGYESNQLLGELLDKGLIIVQQQENARTEFDVAVTR